MARMTEEEANALDEIITNADITLKPDKGGIFTRQQRLLDAQDQTGDDHDEEDKNGYSAGTGELLVNSHAEARRTQRTMRD